MNHIYRLCWNRTLKAWVPASELASSRTGGARRRMFGHGALMLSALSVSLGMTGLAHAASAPTGGQITAGSGQIQQSGHVTTIQQNSATLSLNWLGFDIGADQTVNFVQPGASSIAVNRVLGNSASDIEGHLNANGQVWLINPNGVLFGKDAQVNVGGIVASTLDFDDSTIGTGSVRFAGDGKGKVVNKGAITAASHGYVALLGNQVSNQGVIRAQLGTVALGGGSAVTLTFSDSHLMHLQVDRSTLDNLAENRQLIVADGGTVLMTAGARDSLLSSVVNNTGTVQARGVEEHDGTITLLGGMEAGTVQVGGTLDASAPDGGNGGEIETSAAHFQLAADARITAAAARGKAGTWLVDPVDLTIDQPAAQTISAALNGGTNVTETTTASGASGYGTQTAGGNGDITIASAISWNSSATLELDAYRNINVNALVSGTGGIVMNASGGTLSIGSAGGLSATNGAVLQAGAFVNNAAGSALGSKWLLYSANPALNTLGGITPAFIQYNATKGSSLAAAGNGLIYSAAPSLQITGLKGTVSKVYDNASNADNFTGANFNSTGLIGGDTIASATGGTYASVDAGSGINVTSPGAIGNFSIVNGGVPVYGYALAGSPVSGRIGQISPRALTAQIVGDPTKTYDGTTTATLTSANYEIDGFVAGQGATVRQPSSIAYAGSDAGAQALNATFSVTNFVAGSGTNLANYILPTTATGMGQINKAPLLISGLLADNKVYDGTTSAHINAGGASLFGVIQPDAGLVQLGTGGITGTFADANVANGIAVAVSGYTLTGSKAGNYDLQAPAGLAASITPKTLTISQVTANDKTYDATALATLNTGAAGLNGVVGSDDVSLDASAATAAFGQADVGNHLAVTTGGFALGGSMARNYTLSQPQLFANITPALLTIGMTGTPQKTYDGTNAVTLGSGNFAISGFIGGQHAVVAQSSATYATANAGSGIDVTATLQPSDFTPDAGTSMSNYTFAPTVVGNGLGRINPLQLTGQIVNNPTKVYDGDANAALGASNLQLVGLLPGQTINASFSGTEAGLYDSANAGARGVTAGALPGSDFTAGGGTLLSNYVLPTTWTGSGTITPAPLTGGFVLTAGIVNASKVYDGTTDIVLNGANFTLSGFVNGDSAVVNDGIHATFGQKDVGTQIPLSALLAISDLTATGTTTQQELGNYQIVNPVLGLGDITPRQLLVSIVGNPTKVYNGSVQALLSSANFGISGWAPGEGGTISPTATATYDSANAGARTVSAVLTPGNYVVNGGTSLSNYAIVSTASGAGTIKQAPLFVTGVFATDKVYDTTTADTLNMGNAGLAGLVDSDAGNVSLDLSGVVANFAQKNVGSWAVNATGFNLGGSQAANYLLQPVTGLSARITPRALTLSGVSAQDKTYDGNATAALTVSGTAALNGVLGSDTVGFDASGANAHFSTANAGTGISVTANGFALSGADAGNYQLAQPAGLAAAINPKQLTAVIVGSPTKVYDGTDSATLTAADYDLQGFVAGQGASVPQSATANYVTRNAGTGLGVVSTLVTSDFVANAGTNLSNYILPTTGAGNNGVIQPKVLDLTGTRVYDGTTTANGSLFGMLQGVNGETLGVTGSGTLSSRNVGDAWSFASLGSLALANGGNGGLAGNYTLVGGTDWVTITPKALTADFTANDKTYDGTTAATLAGAAVLDGLIGGDDVTLNNPSSARFSDKNAGAGKTVTGAMSISGGDAGNYTFTQGTASASINALHITVTATGKDRQYDATTADNGAKVQSAGVLAGDTVNFGFGSATFADKNVGGNKTVTVAGVTKSGADANNYVVDNTTLTTTANITARAISLSGTRVYDGTATADAGLFASGGVLSTGFGGETLTLAGTGSVADKNVGANKSLGLGSLALADGGNGGLASNYVISAGSLTITPRDLTATFSASNKTYDGNTGAVLTGAALELANGDRGLVGGDNVSLTNATAGTFDTKNVGTGKTVTGNMGITGADAGNYSFTNGTALADIGKLTLTVGATGQDKVYDGTTDDAGLTYFSNKLAGDDIRISSGSVAFVDKNVGTHKTINVGGITIGGTDAGNYDLQNTTATTQADITPYLINLHASRVYDGTTGVSALLFGNGVVNGVNGETLTLGGSSSVADKNVASNKAFNGAGDMTLGDRNGALASNYLIGSSTLDITPLAVTGTLWADNKVYDGTTAAVTHGTIAGLVGGDVVTLGTSGMFDTKNVANGKTVTVNGTASGADAGNYVFTFNSTATANVTPLAITVGVTANDKVYDGTTAATAAASSAGVLAGDVVSFGAGTAAFSDKNVANGKRVDVSGITASGADAGNYVFNTTATTTADITPLAITVALTSADKVYDGCTAAASLLTSGGILAGDTVNFSGNPASFSDKNVANGKTVTVDGIAASGADAGNYSFNTTATTTANITPLAITGSIVADNKVYDGTTAAVTHGTLAGVIAGDTVDFGTSGVFDTKNVAAGKTVAVNGALSGVDAGNYVFTANATTTADITPLAITVSLASADKVYDGTTAAVGTLAGHGVLAGDTVSFGGDPAHFSDKNVANGKTVTVDGIVASGADAGNYTYNATATTLASITPLAITVGLAAQDKVYDGNAIASGTLSSSGVLAGDTVNFGSNPATFGDKNVANGKTVTASGITAGGADAGNYVFNTTATTTADITPLSISVGATADDKVYDGGTAASAHASSTGVLAGDTVDFAVGAAAFGDKNVGHGKQVDVSGITASGADAGNYVFNPTAQTNASITPLAITVGLTAQDKVYDGNAAAIGALGSTGVLGGDVVNFSGHPAMFSDKNAANGKTVTVDGIVASGTDAGNYAFNTTATTTANITPLAITGTITAGDKVYDGNTHAVVDGSLSGVLGGDQVSLVASGVFQDKNAGHGKTVDVGGQLRGADAGNYTLGTNATTTASITPAVLDLTGTRVYDGTRNADASLFGDNGVLAGVNGETLTLSGSGHVGDRNVGTRKAFASDGLAGFALAGNGGALASNYTLAGGTDWLTITPATLTVIGTRATDRVYDGTRIDALTGATLSGVFGNDDVTLGNAATGLFDDRNVGNGKAVTTAMTVSGGDVGNYVFVQPTGLVASITPRPINVTATGTDKMFDGNTIDKVSLAAEGVIAGDQVVVSHQAANFADSNVGNGKVVTVTGIEASGADAGNYVIAEPTVTTFASITGAQPSAFGVNTAALADLQGMVGPSEVATPYGVAEQGTVGVFTGNHKKQHRPLERHRERDDFTSGLALKVVDGGVHVPVRALP